MAVELNGTDQSFTATASPRSGLPLTIAARMLPRSLTGDKTLVKLANGDDSDYVRLALVDDDVRYTLRDDNVDTHVTYSEFGAVIDTWQIVMARSASSTSHQVGRANGNASSSSSSNPSGFDNVVIGEGFDGGLADVGIWSVSLSDSERNSYFRGVCALNLQPTTLVAWWPFMNATGQAWWGSVDLTANNSPVRLDQPRTLPFRRPMVLSRIVTPSPPSSYNYVSLERRIRGLNRGLVA